MNPGIYDHLSNADYHAALGISKSGLDLIDRSPAHYAARYRDGVESPPTPAMVFGTAFHMAVLEPAKFAESYVIGPNTKRGTKAWNAFESANLGKEILKQEDYDKILRMADAVHGHLFARTLLTDGRAERSVFWNDPETGVLCRIRPDWQRVDGTLVDLKTTTDARQYAFEKAVANFRYHVQAAFYADGIQAAALSLGDAKGLDFCFIAVEKDPPHVVAVYMASAEMVHAGRRQYRENLQRYAECLQKKDWPGYPEEVQIINLPRWAA